MGKVKIEKESHNINTLALEVALANFIDFRKSDVIFNITPISQLLEFETDVLEITKAGYLNAFELKISKSDFKKDSEKRHLRDPRLFGLYFKSLKTFSYVVPEFLKEFALENIPEYAGLYSAFKFPLAYNPNRIFIECIKSPKQLFSGRDLHKVSDQERLSFLRLGNMRVITLKNRLI